MALHERALAGPEKKAHLTRLIPWGGIAPADALARDRTLADRKFRRQAANISLVFGHFVENP